MPDGPENLRRIIRLIEEMDAYFARLESTSLVSNATSTADTSPSS